MIYIINSACSKYNYNDYASTIKIGEDKFREYAYQEYKNEIVSKKDITKLSTDKIIELMIDNGMINICEKNGWGWTNVITIEGDNITIKMKHYDNIDV